MRMQISHPHYRYSKTIHHILCLGFLILLSGMFWLPERPDYHRAFYITLALPTFIALVMAPRRIPLLFSNGIFLIFLIFSIYCLLSLTWSDTDNALTSLAKRPLYISLLFFAVTLIALHSEKNLYSVILTGMTIAAISAALSVSYFIFFDTTDRLPGYRALYNPLLTSHVYGMFAAMCMALFFHTKRNQLPYTLPIFSALFTLIILTGSRTPLLGLAATCTWLVLPQRNRVAYNVLASTLAIGSLLLLVNPESITNRGLSYRPEIWHQAWLQIQNHLWFGHGYDHPMIFWVEGISYAFADPHNMELAVLFSGGIVGLLLWLALYATALVFAWRNRQDRLVLLASSALIFGFTAGLTEGNAFLSRPKEHWFLIWIPFSLLAAAWTVKKAKNYAKET